MAALRYLVAYLDIWLQFFDHKAAKRAGQLAARTTRGICK